MKKLFGVMFIFIIVFGIISTASAGKVIVVERFYSGTGDGDVRYNSASTWATAHDATSGTNVYSTSTEQLVGTNSESSYYYIGRAFLPFDTSDIGANSVIMKTTLNIYSYYQVDSDDDSDAYIAVVEALQASISSLTLADYDNIGVIEGSDRLDITDVTDDDYNTFTLNSIGLAWIKKVGTTKIGMRSGHDINNNPVTIGWTAIWWRSSEQTGTDNDPYLEVTYLCDENDAPSVGGDVISVTDYPIDADYNGDNSVDAKDIDNYLEDVQFWIKNIWEDEISY